MDCVKVKEEKKHPLYDSDEEEFAEECGCEFRCCGVCRTKRYLCRCFSCCANPKVLLVFLSLTAFIQGIIVSGFVNVSISSFERRFNLQSSETAFIGISYDIGSFACLLFVTYIGGKSVKPLWLGWGIFFSGCGCIIISLPHFIAPKYDYSGGNGTNLCGNVTIETCTSTQLRGYRWFLIAGQVILGMGTSPLYSLGYIYLDENVLQRYSSLYHGIFNSFSLVGPGVGYIVGGALLSIYTNIGEEVDFGPESQLWIGAWWIGFLIGGILAIILSIPLQMFPYQFKNTEEVRKNRQKEMYNDKLSIDVKDNPAFGERLKDVPKSFCVIIRNKVLILISLGGAMEMGFVVSTATFGPKYIETMFAVSASSAAFSFGIVTLIGGLVGIMLSAIIITRFTLTVPKMLVICAVSTLISLFCSLCFLIVCEPIDFAGGTVPYYVNESISGVISECNKYCGCKPELYSPVCGANNVTYFSPCHAGCIDDDFTSCSCINDSNVGVAATLGQCTRETSCSFYGMFIGIAFIGIFFTFCNSIPALQASIRVVPFSQRSFAIGVQWVILRLIGAIPGALILGAVFDSTCIVWNDECGQQGTCKVYNNYFMARYSMTVLLIYKFLGTLFFALAYVLYHPHEASETKVGDKKHSEDLCYENNTITYM